jgi:hypothetical protein
MRRIIICGMLAGSLMVALIISGAPASGQIQPNNMIEQRIELHVNQGTLLQALSTLSVDKRVPIGFEPALGHKHEHNLNIDADNATLRDVLDRIVQQEPGYKWEVRDSVISIVPTKLRDDFVEKLLSTPIHRFDSPKVLGPSQIRDAIVDLPEVVALLKANGITASRYGYFYHYPSLYTNSNVDLSISETDVRGILNTVVRESEHKMWIVSRSGKNLTSLDIGF